MANYLHKKKETRHAFDTSSKQVTMATKRRLIAKLQLWPSFTFSSFSSRVFATRIFRFEGTNRWLNEIEIDEDGWKIEMLIDDDR